MTGFHMFKFIWMVQRRELVPIITAFLHAAYAEIMWHIQLRTEIRKLRRQSKIWNKIKIPVELNTRGQVFVTLSLRKEEKDFVEGEKKMASDLHGEQEEKDLLSYLKRGRYFF